MSEKANTVHPHVLAGAKAHLAEIDDNPFAWDTASLARRESAVKSVEVILAAAYPELAAGTHAVLPVEATEKMLSCPGLEEYWDGCPSMQPAGAWSAMVRAGLDREKADIEAAVARLKAEKAE